MGGSAQVIPTDGPPPGQRTGMIVGQVVDAATGRPVDEAIVRLTMPKYLENLPTSGPCSIRMMSPGTMSAARRAWVFARRR